MVEMGSNRCHTMYSFNVGLSAQLQMSEKHQQGEKEKLDLKCKLDSC